MRSSSCRHFCGHLRFQPPLFLRHAAVAIAAGILSLPVAVHAQSAPASDQPTLSTASDAGGWRGNTGRRLYLEAGGTLRGGARAESITAGVLVPSDWFPSLDRQAGPLTLHWDLWASHWQGPAGDAGGRRTYTQLGAMAVWRHALGTSSPWFVELGFGGTVMDRLYRSPDDTFSTAFQFTESAGLGYRFGPRDRYELSLRLQHVSNGGIKKPNPGATFAKLRLSMAW